MRIRRSKITPKTFFLLFTALIISLALVSHSLYGLYVQMFNDGTITDAQVWILGSVTLAAAIGITVFVGVKYLLGLKALPRSRRLLPSGLKIAS